MSTNKVTSLGFTSDAQQVAPQTALEAVPAGWYNVVLVDGESTPNDGGNGRRLSLTWEIIEGQYKGRKIYDGLNLVHSNADAQRIAQAQFSALCHAVGVFQVTDVTQLFQKPHQIQVGIEAKRTVDADGKDKDASGQPYAEGTPNTKTYDAKNRFKTAKFGAAPAAAAATGAPGGPAPAWAATGDGSAATNTAAPGNGAAGAPTSPTPATATAPTPVAPSAAGTKPGKPSAKPASAKPSAAKPKAERKFFVGLDGDAYAEPWPESKVADALAKGMPAETPLCLEGETEYKNAAAYGISATAAAAPTPSPAAATPTPAPAAATATAGGAKLPPWAQ